MFTIENLDASTPFLAQLAESTGSVVLVNTFLVPGGAMDAVMGTWGADAAFMKAQPGFISAQLHRGIGTSRLLLNVSVWESVSALKAAFGHPQFKDKAKSYPDGLIVYPHVFEKLSVAGVCVS